MCTPAQGLFAHAATLGAPTIVVTHAKHERYKNICAGEPPERVHAARRLAYQVGVLAFGCRTRAAADRPAQEAGRFGMVRFRVAVVKRSVLTSRKASSKGDGRKSGMTSTLPTSAWSGEALALLASSLRLHDRHRTITIYDDRSEDDP